MFFHMVENNSFSKKLKEYYRKIPFYFKLKQINFHFYIKKLKNY